MKQSVTIKILRKNAGIFHVNQIYRRMETNIPISSHRFSCVTCGVYTNHKQDYIKHLATSKHYKLTKVDTALTEKIPNFAFTCKHCSKKYTSRAGLWKHNKICIKPSVNTESEDPDEYDIKDKDALILKLLQQNGELQKSLIAMSREKGITNNTKNSHNTFNLNFFLNETCKNALNITEFVSSIKPTLEDLEYTGKLGYVEGVSNIIIKKLNSLEEYVRPIHCSDQKREVMYIKDNNKWEREAAEEKPLLTKAIKVIANENIKNIKEWQNQHPNCMDPNSKKNNMYLNIVSNSMCGIDKEEWDRNLNRIISNVAKEVHIQKEGC
jgi:hypothetical protein